MKTFARKSVSLLLAVIMIVSLFTIIPISASAAATYTIEFTYNNSTHTESNVASLSNLTYSMSTIAGWFNGSTNQGGAFRISTYNPNLSSSNSNVASISGSGSDGVVTIGGSTGSSTLGWRASNQNRTLTVTVSEGNHGYDSNNDPSAKSNLTYSGSAKALVNGGTATHTEGTIFNAKTYSYRFSTSTSATSQPQNSTYTATTLSATNAGTYYVWWIWDYDSSYSNAVAHGGFTVTIGKADAQITTAPEANELTYTSEEQALVTAGASSFGKVLYSLDRGEYGESIPTAKDAGDYVVSYKVEGTDNYNGVDAQSIDVTIEKATPDVDLATKKLYYTGQWQDLVQSAKVTIAGADGDVEIPDEAKLWYSLEGGLNELDTSPVGKEIGTYDIYTRVEALSENVNAVDYAAEPYCTVEIAAAPTVTMSDYTYGVEDELPTPEVEGNLGDGAVTYKYYPADGDAEDAEVWDDATTELTLDAGDYKMFAEIAESETAAAVVTDPVDFTVGVKTVDEPVIELSYEEIVYSGEENKPEVTVKDGEVVISADEYEVSYSENIDAGTATVTVTDKEGGNYTVSGTLEFVIDKADIAPEVTIEGWAYGDEANEPEVTGNDGEGEVTYLYAKQSDLDALDEDAEDYEEQYEACWSEEVPTDADDYTVKAVIAETDNYNAGEATADFTIAQATIFPTITIEGWTYGDEPNEPEVTGNTGNGEETIIYAKKADLDALDLEAEDYIDQYNACWSEEVPENAGEYVVSAKIAETDNYREAYCSAPFTIAKADLVMAEDGDYYVTANDLVFNNEQQDLVTEYVKEDSGFVVRYSFYPDGMNPHVAGNIPRAKDAGLYPIYYMVEGDENHNDVEWTLIPLFATIDEAELTLTIDDWAYGETASEPVATANFTDYTAINYTYAEQGSDTFEETVPTDVGHYTVKASVASNNECYNTLTATADFEITKGTITPVITIEGWTYGEEPNKPVVTGNTGDAEVTYYYQSSDLDGAPFVEGMPTEAGNYILKAVFDQTDCYNGAEAFADFTVAKAALTVTAKNQTIAYGSAVAQDKYTVDGLVDGDEITVKINSSIAQNIVKPVVTASDNYDVTVVTGILTIKGSPIANALPSGKNIVAKWSAVTNADGYDIYAGYCGSGNYPLIKSVKNQATTSFTITKLGGKAINMKKNIFLYVVAYKNVNGKKVTLVRSASLHVAGTSTNYTNAKSVKVSASTLTLAKGKTYTVKPTVTLVDKTKTQPKCVSKLQYATSNSSVAKVDANGKITAVGKGTANVYVFAENGVKAKVAVTVQ